MRKSLFTIGLLAVSYSVQAQILCHVDANANMYVSKGTLVYNGGGLEMKDNGKIENHGNFMVVGSGTDLLKTIDAGGTNKTESNGGGNFVNMLNEPTAYASRNKTDDGGVTPPVYTYGQLYVSGLSQANITGIVDQEFRAIPHGAYQQIGIPFWNKTPSTLSTELGKTFSTTRWSKNEILYWDNTNVVSKNLTSLTNLASLTGTAAPAYAYYMLGATGLDLSTTRVVKGRPVADDASTPSITLQNAGAAVNFGPTGSNLNQYNEKYWSYVRDSFTMAAPWTSDYGRNWYQFSNPYLTNLDLSQIGTAEASGDGVNLTNIYGIRLEVSGVTWAQPGGTSANYTYKFVTFASGVPTGDVGYMILRPLESFAIKLKDNTSQTFDFKNLRRFNYHTRASATPYSVTASKSASSAGTVKQLGVIALDADGKELGRTYYVVYPNGTTGYSVDAKTQAIAESTNVVGTYEEAPTGGYDMNYINTYWLYINEANENNFKGKNVKLKNYSTNIKSYKFEIRENASTVADGTHLLSSGTGFYYKALDGTVQQAKQGDVIPVTNSEYDLYYGEPNNSVLAAEETTPVKSSRTMVTYNPDITNYVVRFDPNWKKADIEVYDMSGKLVISKKAVNTSTDFVIELNNSIKNSYVVKIVSDKGETVNTKILK